MKFNLDLEDVNYIKIVYKNPDGEVHSIKAAMKRVDEREILSCVKSDEEIIVNTPQEVTLSIVCSNGLYITKTKLKSVDIEIPYIFFIMEIPDGLEYRQNREYFRVPAKYYCKYACLTAGGEMQQYSGETYDISANGVSMILPAYVIPGDNSEIELYIDGRTVKTDARYIRTERENFGYKLSFMYENISEPDRDFISQVCIKKQLEQRRNKLG